MKKIVGFLILTFCMLALLSVVASAETVILKAGQSIDAGTVTVSYDGVNLCVTYETEGDWELVETHFAIATSPGDIPQNKNGNPKVGHFLYGDDELGEYEEIEGIFVLVGGKDSHEECIELELEVGTYIIAAQAKLVNTEEIDDEGNLVIESGWGEGDEFDGKNWAMYFEFTVVVEEE